MLKQTAVEHGQQSLVEYSSNEFQSAFSSLNDQGRQACVVQESEHVAIQQFVVPWPIKLFVKLPALPIASYRVHCKTKKNLERRH
jgi:hypothetical protein